MGRRGYSPEFRQRVIDLVEGGRRVADVASDLGISEETIYTWRRQDRIDRGLVPGLSSAERAELAAAKTRIRELETELYFGFDGGVTPHENPRVVTVQVTSLRENTVAATHTMNAVYTATYTRASAGPWSATSTQTLCGSALHGDLHDRLPGWRTRTGLRCRRWRTQKRSR